MQDLVQYSVICILFFRGGFHKGKRIGRHTGFQTEAHNVSKNKRLYLDPILAFSTPEFVSS